MAGPAQASQSRRGPAAWFKATKPPLPAPLLLPLRPIIPHFRVDGASSFNLSLAQFVMGPEAKESDLRQLLKKTTAHVIVLFVSTQIPSEDVKRLLHSVADTPRVAGDGTPLPGYASKELATNETADTWLSRYLLWQPNKVHPPIEGETLYRHDQCYFEVLYCSTVGDGTKPCAEFRIGVFLMPSGYLEDDCVTRLIRCVNQNKVGLRIGVFGDSREEIEELCHAAVADGQGPACQPWLFSETLAAVAPPPPNYLRPQSRGQGKTLRPRWTTTKCSPPTSSLLRTNGYMSDLNSTRRQIGTRTLV